MTNALETLESRTYQSITPMPRTHTDVPSGQVAQLTIPATPTNLTDMVTGHSVKLQWTETSTDQTGFDIVRYSGKVAVELGVVTAKATTFTDPNAPAGQYSYVVRAFNTTGGSEGASVSVTIKSDPIVSVVPPNKVSVAAVSTTQLSITWQGDAGATRGYTIQRSSNGLTGWTTAGTTVAGTRTFTDKGLAAKTKYFYRIVANGAGDASATSAVCSGLNTNVITQ